MFVPHDVGMVHGGQDAYLPQSSLSLLSVDLADVDLLQNELTLSPPLSDQENISEGTLANLSEDPVLLHIN